MHHECIHQCTINALITASSMHRASCNTSSMHSLHQMHQFRSFSSSFHHQCIVSAFINASPMYSSVYSSLNHQGNPSMHHQCFVNTLSMPSPTNHQSIVSAFVNASSMHSSMHLVINIPSMHHHCIKCINSFFHLLNSFKLVHLHCCSFIRFFVAVTLSAFLLSFLNSLYPFNSFFRPSFLRSLFVPVFISSTIILFLCLANSWFNTLPTRSVPCCVNSQFYALEKKSTMLCNLLYHHASVFERTNQRRKFCSKHAQDKLPNQPGNGRSRYAFDAISCKW